MFFSIIVPVYNSSDVILRCLESIAEQNFHDYEVIIVNDGSIDESKIIIEDYISDKNQFILINKDNGGVSSARNQGVDLSGGDYIIFLDSDDWIGKGYFEFAYNNLKFGYDGLILSYYECKGNNEKLIMNDLARINDSQLDIEQLFLQCVIKNSPCDKIFKRSIYDVHQVKFPEGLSVGEDACATLQILQNATNILAREDAFLKYQLDTNGVTKTKMTNKKLKDIINVVNIIEKSTTSKNKTHSYYYNMRLIIDYYFKASKEPSVDSTLIERETYRLVKLSDFSSVTSNKQKLYLLVIKSLCILRILRFVSYMR
ncbi:glycosyltransferase family 2 protein [Vibrio splendidus]